MNPPIASRCLLSWLMLLGVLLNAVGAFAQGLGLSGAADLNGRRVGVLQGSAHEVYATAHYPRATIMQFQSFADVMLAVKAGKVDVGISDDIPLRTIVRDHPSIAALGGPLMHFPVAAGFNRQDAELRARFDRFLADIRADGTYDAMAARWIEGRDPHMPAIAEPANGAPLDIGVAVVGLPFLAVQDDALAGFDIELARRFAAHIGRTPRFASMDFGALVPAVASRKVQMVIASIFVTEERRQRIDFSVPYFETGASAFALRSNIAGAGDATRAGAESPVVADGFLARVADSFHANLIAERRYLLILDGLGTTILISVCATLFGTVLGALVCGMRLSRRALLHLPARAYIALLRGTPVLVLLMLIFYVVFASLAIEPVLVAVLAFGMNFAAYSAEIFRAGIGSIDRGQTEAGIAMGFSRVGAFVHIVLPQTVRRILPVYKGEFISLVKMTSVVGYIAVQDLTKAGDIIRSRTFDAFFPLVMVALLYFLISGLMALALDAVERRLDPRRRRRAEHPS